MLDMKTGEKYIKEKTYQDLLKEVYDNGPVQKTILEKKRKIMEAHLPVSPLKMAIHKARGGSTPPGGHC